MIDGTIEVEETFPWLKCSTRLWWSEKVRKEIEKLLQTNGRKNANFLDDLLYYAQAGFLRYEGNGHGKPIRHEGRQVYRISDGGKFRVGGYYEDHPRKTSFFAIDAFEKRGEKNSSTDRKRYQDIADARDAGRIVKKGPTNGNYPRLANDS